MKNFIYIVLMFIGNLISGQNLQDYYKVALENNPNVKSKYIDFEISIQKIAQANSISDPNFSFGYFISPAQTKVGPQLAKFSITQAIPWFGLITNLDKYAKLNAESKFQIFNDSKNLLYFQLSSVYFELNELNTLFQIEKENIELLELYKKIIIGKFENGLSNMTDVLKIDLLLNESKLNLNIIEDKMIPLKSSFNRLMNCNIDNDVNIDKRDFVIVEFKEELIDSVISRNAILNSFDINIESSQIMESISKKQSLPKLGLGVDYVIVGKDQGVNSMIKTADNGKDILMPMISVSLPIYRKKYNANIKESKLINDQYIIKKEDYRNNLLVDYKMAVYEKNKQYEIINYYIVQISQLNQVLELQFKEYSNDKKGIEELLKVQQELLKNKKNKEIAITLYLKSIAKLNYLSSKNL